MCRTCGCGDHEHVHDPWQPKKRVIALETAVLAKNDLLAERLRRRLAQTGVTALNLIGSPGAGKTTLLEHTIRALSEDITITVLEGDQATDHDAKRIAATGSRVVQINTGAGCHLDATMVESGLDQLAPQPGSLLLIENVGNLVCPALFDLGERAKIVILSVTEGEDKPLKYPHVFRAASALVLTKADLMPHLAVDVLRYIANARQINPRIEMFEVAAMRGDGMADWCGWLRGQLGRPA